MGRNLLILSFIFFFFTSCSKDLRKDTPPIEDVLHHGPLARIMVYSGNVALGQTGALANGLSIGIGGTAILSAQGKDSNNRSIKIKPKWTASKSEIIEIDPTEGDIVSVKGIREGTSEIVVEYKGVKTTVEYIWVK
ncbi:MAG: hypothetical protein KA059_04985 [Elusimicrobiales bacterium]|jgi:hypothetical protein|nr:hypothetical protein [Elusimicrobiales bacterium]NLH39593.1 hypothetical protein [Elusimicrobiota bacterium]